MVNTLKEICRDLASQLAARGVRFAVLSPGSRNAPIVMALERHPDISTKVVIDERSAAFIALGYAAQSGEPVAVVCTSGTALLNYAPAVAEAFYRKVPLIVISADRPMEWIDQDDSQTIRQHEALANYVKASYNLTDIELPNLKWYANRQINDALTVALTGRRAPVHINIQLSEPLTATTAVDSEKFRKIAVVEPEAVLPTAEARRLGTLLASPRKVMIVAGFNPPSPTLNRALRRLAALPNFIVLTETVSNLHANEFISRIDTTLSAMTEEERLQMAPDAVITLGGALVSRMVKTYLRDAHPADHWHVGKSHTTVDCFQSLTMRIEMAAETFFPQLASAMQPHTAPTDYADRWRIIRDRAISTHQAYTARAPWSDLKAFATFMPMLPRGTNLQLSNGTPVRYAQLIGDTGLHRCDCNRGVSGIDGCTSTAIGAALAYSSGITVLVTGDMSAQYDLGALATADIPPRFKMIVMCNSGGGIFRFISSTAQLPEREKNFAAAETMRLPVRQLADAFGFAFFSADSEASLREVFPEFIAGSSSPAILAIDTPAQTDAEVLAEYFHRSEIFKNKR
ncbi:MAG: 2-succinyl-5-enolpyruvyl-6-hydroxy-3-cyclohexene-1-carboxylic-acid synthase [Muribaculaceae bacterium]|nr:2-succinyl-5-enolpyruvyl-6-hydroxy-3-cyclohexene-1-carboxylic-acid synthase [Muribaculaceae bacterium]